MKKSKFSEAQITFILKQAEGGATIGEVCRKAGFSEATFNVWRKKYGGLLPSELSRMRQLEDENGRLKRIVALGKSVSVHPQASHLSVGENLRLPFT